MGVLLYLLRGYYNLILIFVQYQAKTLYWIISSTKICDVGMLIKTQWFCVKFCDPLINYQGIVVLISML